MMSKEAERDEEVVFLVFEPQVPNVYRGVPAVSLTFLWSVAVLAIQSVAQTELRKMASDQGQQFELASKFFLKKLKADLLAKTLYNKPTNRGQSKKT